MGTSPHNKRRLALMLTVAIATVGLASPASATHNDEARKWDRQQSGIYNYAPRYYYDSNVPSACRTAFSNGASVWNNRNRELRYLSGSGYTVYIRVLYYDLAWPYNDDLAFSELDAFTDITWQKINYNNNVDRSDGGRWYPYCGTGTPASNQYDFWSLTIHELGHNQIQNHTSDTRDIMYPTLPIGGTKRTLSTHDIDTFNALYAAAS